MVILMGKNWLLQSNVLSFFHRRMNFCLIIVLFKQNRIHSFTVLHILCLVTSDNDSQYSPVLMWRLSVILVDIKGPIHSFAAERGWSVKVLDIATLWLWTTLWSCLERQSWTTLCVILLNQHQSLFSGCLFQVCNNAQKLDWSLHIHSRH